MAAEKNFEEKVKKYLKENRCWFLKYWGGGGFTKSGIPDLLVCCKGWFMGVEIKAPNGKPSDLQIYNLRKIDSAGGRAILLYPKDYDLFKRLVNNPDDQKLYELLKSKWKRFEKYNERRRMTMTKKKENAEQVATPETVAEVTINYSDIIRTTLMKTKRKGMTALFDYMVDIGFLTAPCSGGNHLAKEGGLAEHSVNVMKYAEKIGVALYGGAEYNKIQDSVAIAALLHDLGKCGDYGKQMYVNNILKTGKVSTAKPFKRNPNLSAVPHAVRSVKIATLFIDLTEDEEWAILCHDGLYDFMKYEMQGHETPLQMIIHWADMWASRVIESGEDQEGGEE